MTRILPAALLTALLALGCGSDPTPAEVPSSGEPASPDATMSGEPGGTGGESGTTEDVTGSTADRAFRLALSVSPFADSALVAGG
ncbi:MAG: hypothetical protein EA398_01895 [Deltaproteobacteria bacterium]|nr:MAG: hypothetical protein EA398_01895 [Deltaproteobacteria bacterium]